MIQARVPVVGQSFQEHRIVGTMVSAGPQGTVLYCNSTANSPSPAAQPVRLHV